MKHFLCLTDTNKQMINGRILQDEIKFRCAKMEKVDEASG
ncbi:MAG: hypothetical protein ACI8R0_003201 [Alteromonadales bacterium]|jgi:hypothetical protein|tara:strand:- start:1218 stop:1337 length:120 start_codon:yes stop_codon:yes gene_type:complete